MADRSNVSPSSGKFLNFHFLNTACRRFYHRWLMYWSLLIHINLLQNQFAANRLRFNRSSVLNIICLQNKFIFLWQNAINSNRSVLPTLIIPTSGQRQESNISRRKAPRKTHIAGFLHSNCLQRITIGQWQWLFFSFELLRKALNAD